MITSQQKGDALERAVKAIELAILRQSPSYHEKTIRIEGKKSFKSSAGVPHEVDISVTVEIASGYEATYIFECKNWTRKVGKREVSDFARKIVDANAQKGFLVAAALTKGAEAMVRSEPRMDWLMARELSADEVPERVRRFYGVFSETIDVYYNIVQQENGTPQAIDPKAATFTLHGKTEDLGTYLRGWADEVKKPTTEGVHPFEAVRRYSADEGLTLDSQPIREISASGNVRVTYIPGVIISRFEVATRGRVAQCAVNFPDGTRVVMQELRLHASGSQ